MTMKSMRVEGWSAIGKWTGTPLREFLRRVGDEVAVAVPVADQCPGHLQRLCVAAPDHAREVGASAGHARLRDSRDRRGVIAQAHVVQERAVREPVLPGHKAGSVGAANRAAGHGVGEIHALASQLIEVGRPYVHVARVAGRLRPPLVREDKNKIRLIA